MTPTPPEHLPSKLVSLTASSTPRYSSCGEVPDVPRIRRLETVAFTLGNRRLRLNRAEVDAGTDAERPSVLSQQLARDEVRLRRRRSDEVPRVDVDSGNADPRGAHAGEVVDDDAHSSSEMDGVDVGPPRSQVLAHKTAMTVLRDGLGAQQCRAPLEIARGEHLVYATLIHDSEEVGFIGRPIAFVLLVRVQQILGGCKQRFVLIRRTDQLKQEVR